MNLTATMRDVQWRTQALQICTINGVLVLCNTTLQYNVCFTASVWNYVKATKEYAAFTCSLENIQDVAQVVYNIIIRNC